MARLCLVFIAFFSWSVFAEPRIDVVSSEGATLWVAGSAEPARVRVGQWLTLKGTGFGGGPDADFAKVLVGTSRPLERDVKMFTGAVDLLEQLFYEKPK